MKDTENSIKRWVIKLEAAEGSKDEGFGYDEEGELLYSIGDDVRPITLADSAVTYAEIEARHFNSRGASTMSDSNALINWLGEVAKALAARD